MSLVVYVWDIFRRNIFNSVEEFIAVIVVTAVPLSANKP